MCQHTIIQLQLLVVITNCSLLLHWINPISHWCFPNPATCRYCGVSQLCCHLFLQLGWHVEFFFLVIAVILVCMLFLPLFFLVSCCQDLPSVVSIANQPVIVFLICVDHCPSLCWFSYHQCFWPLPENFEFFYVSGSYKLSMPCCHLGAFHFHHLHWLRVPRGLGRGLGLFQQHLISDQHLLLLCPPVSISVILLLLSLLLVLLLRLLVLLALWLLNQPGHLYSQLSVLQQFTGTLASAAVGRCPVHHEKLLQLLLGVFLLGQGCMGDLHDGTHELFRQSICLRVFWCTLHRFKPHLLGIFSPFMALVWTSPIMDHLLGDALPRPHLVQSRLQLLKTGILDHAHLRPP